MRVTGLTPQDLKAYGIHDVQEVVYNPDYDTLYQEELNPALEGYERGVLTNHRNSPLLPAGVFQLSDQTAAQDDRTYGQKWRHASDYAG